MGSIWLLQVSPLVILHMTTFLDDSFVMIRFCIASAFLISIFWADSGMCQEHAVAVSAGRDGAAQITIANGEKITIQKEPGQVGVGESHIASNGNVGWLAEYQIDGVNYPLAEMLVLWRAGKTI